MQRFHSILSSCFGAHTGHVHAVADVPVHNAERGATDAVDGMDRIISIYNKSVDDKRMVVCHDHLAEMDGQTSEWVGQGGRGDLCLSCASTSSGTDEEEDFEDHLRLDDLPVELLEHVFAQMKDSMEGSKSKRVSRLTREDVQSMFAVCSVSKRWREAGQRVFFSSPWPQSSHFAYHHPNQMFCTSPEGPKGSRSGLVKCFVKREHGDHLGGKMVITMFLGKNHSSRNSFMLSAVGRGRSSYEIYLERAENACDRSNVEPCAWLECNMLCTSYRLRIHEDMWRCIESGVGTREYRDWALCSSSDTREAEHRKPQHRDALSLNYRARMRGIMQPRRMEVALSGDEEGLVCKLQNKNPHWNEGMHCWCLNFRGRVKLASVKNFQLVLENANADQEESIVMQFGKVDNDVFILDYNPKLMSPIQAFATALSTFNGRMLGGFIKF